MTQLFFDERKVDASTVSVSTAARRGMELVGGYSAEGDLAPVTMSNGETRLVPRHPSTVILLVQYVCEFIGIEYKIEPFDWPAKGDHVCIRVMDRPNCGFSLVTSADFTSDLNDAEVCVRQTLRAHDHVESAA